MAHILMYTTPVCPFCNRAKALLKSKGITEIEEVNVAAEADRREEMFERSGGRKTVPQIFIDDQHIGGFDDLDALNKQGGLDPLL